MFGSTLASQIGTAARCAVRDAAPHLAAVERERTAARVESWRQAHWDAGDSMAATAYGVVLRSLREEAPLANGATEAEDYRDEKWRDAQT